MNQRGDEYETLAPYLEAARRFRPLGRDEEHVLAVRARDGDLVAAQTLARHNLTFVVAIARAQARGSVRLEDLIQEGNVGLMRAVQKFDPHAGTRFATYAVWWIRAYVGKYLKEARSAVRPHSGTVAQSDVSLDAAIDDDGKTSHLDRLEDWRPAPEDEYARPAGSRSPRSRRAGEGPQAHRRNGLGRRPREARTGSPADPRGDRQPMGRFARARSPDRGQDEGVSRALPPRARSERPASAGAGRRRARAAPARPPPARGYRASGQDQRPGATEEGSHLMPRRRPAALARAGGGHHARGHGVPRGGVRCVERFRLPAIRARSGRRSASSAAVRGTERAFSGS